MCLSHPLPLALSFSLSFFFYFLFCLHRVWYNIIIEWCAYAYKYRCVCVCLNFRIAFFSVSIWTKKKKFFLVPFAVFVLVKFNNETQIYELLLLLLISKVVLLFSLFTFLPEIEFDCSEIICKFEIQLVSQIDYTCCRISTERKITTSFSTLLLTSHSVSLSLSIPRLFCLVHKTIRSSSSSYNDAIFRR